MNNLHTVLPAFVLWIDFAGLTTLIGTVAFQYLIIQQVLCLLGASSLLRSGCCK